MLRSLYSGISGLRQHQTMMDVVGNNIANVNTTGYKSSTITFEDTLSQMLRASASPSATRGGTNPTQVGLGVQLGGISMNFTQGSAQTTGRATDLMIQGDGFFVVRSGDENLYSRAGAFTFDSDGRLVTNQGMTVQGWLGANGVVDTNGMTTDIVLPVGTMIPPRPSTTATISGNITPGSLDVMTLGMTSYDLMGLPHDLSIVMTPDENGAIEIDITEVIDGEATSVASTTGALAFTETGALDVEGSTPPEITLADGTVVTVDISGITAFGGPKSLAVRDADGYTAGTLQQFRIDGDGTVIGIFSNGEKLAMARIALANFNNPQGLEKNGGSTYSSTTNSGLPQVGVPTGGGMGSLIGGSLEMSNVDLAQEFTGLIIAQRGFQANSRVITTSDEMLQELVNIKR